ncbi:retropepsin-like aspartic protease family protein [Rhodoblastus sp.]|uniref:retropepsin-like aspartic protease family protein n=1 Tax=Rhodoblastus sp. TaxID=1962975 RepID=UPI003F9B55C7
MAFLFVTAAQNHWLPLAPFNPPRARVSATQPGSGDPAPAAMAAASHASFGVVELEPDRNAQYQADIEIDGTSIHAMVDTGASLVALTSEDARLLNIDPPASAFHIRTQTANGTGWAAPVRLREIRVNDITVHDVDAMVAQPGALNITLLGMSFLKKLESFQVADGRFVMKQ